MAPNAEFPICSRQIPAKFCNKKANNMTKVGVLWQIRNDVYTGFALILEHSVVRSTVIFTHCCWHSEPYKYCVQLLLHKLVSLISVIRSENRILVASVCIYTDLCEFCRCSVQWNHAKQLYHIAAASHFQCISAFAVTNSTFVVFDSNCLSNYYINIVFFVTTDNFSSPLIVWVDHFM